MDISYGQGPCDEHYIPPDENGQCPEGHQFVDEETGMCSKWIWPATSIWTMSWRDNGNSAWVRANTTWVQCWRHATWVRGTNSLWWRKYCTSGQTLSRTTMTTWVSWRSSRDSAWLWNTTWNTPTTWKWRRSTWRSTGGWSRRREWRVEGSNSDQLIN